MTKRVGYQVPTLKITRSIAADSKAIYQSLADYSNDIQSFLQRFVSTVNENFAQDPTQSNVVANGFIKFGSGLIHQWGKTNVTAAGITIVFPTPFISALFSLVAQNSDGTNSAFFISSTTLLGATFKSGNNTSVWWQAIGK